MSIAIKVYAKYFVGREWCFDPWQFIPETYILSQDDDCGYIIPFLRDKIDERMWLVKKSHNVHNAKGIIPYQHKPRSETNDVLNDLMKVCNKEQDYNISAFIVQKYIENPLLIENKKFDFRVYGFWANMDPLMVLYHDGFVRIAMNDYDKNDTDLKTVVTTMSAFEKTPVNQQQNDPHMTIEQFGDYMYKKGLVE